MASSSGSNAHRFVHQRSTSSASSSAGRSNQQAEEGERQQLAMSLDSADSSECCTPTSSSSLRRRRSSAYGTSTAVPGGPGTPGTAANTNNSPSAGTGGAWAEEGAEFLTLDFSQHREVVHSWLKLPTCDEFVASRRSKHTMVTYKGALYVFGGDNGKQMLNDVVRYDPVDNSWSSRFTMGTLPAPRYHHTAVVYESSMYVFGGYTGDIHSNSNLTNKNDLFEYKFSTGQWSEVQCERRLPPARCGHGAAVFDGKMYVFGGFDGHTRLNDMWCISLAGPIRRWQQVHQNGDTPPPCHNLASTQKGEDWFLFSGQSGAKSTNSLFQFHFPTCSWSRINVDHVLRAASPAPHRRYGHTMTAHNRFLYVFGGAAENIQPADMHCYDLDAHVWRRVHPADGSVAPTGRLFHSAVTLGDCMFIFGGTVDNNVRSSELFRFQFSSYPRCTLVDDFGRLLESRQFCDLRFLVGKDRVPIFAHISIVAARSVYLRNKIKESREQEPSGVPLGEREAQEVKQQQQQQPQVNSPSGSPTLTHSAKRDPNVLDVYLPDAEPFAFEMVLDYIYTDKIDPTQRGQEPGSNGVVLLMMAVYRLSLQFSLKRLETLAVRYLESVLGVKNVLVALQNASRLNLRYIKDYCLRFVIKECNYNQIVMSKEFETLEQPLMVEIIRSRQTPPVKAAPDPQPVDNDDSPSLQSDMKGFLEGGSGDEFCDITLISGGISKPVHKVILAARSAYFEAMFRSWMPESNTVQVSLGEIVPSEHAFTTLLRYIYYGSTEMKPEDSLYLFAAPAFYGFSNNRLQAFCKENLETNIRTENVLEILEAADRIQANEMKRHSLKLIVEQFSKVARQQKLRHLSRELLLDIISAVADGINGQQVQRSAPGQSASRADSNDSISCAIGQPGYSGGGVGASHAADPPSDSDKTP